AADARPLGLFAALAPPMIHLLSLDTAGNLIDRAAAPVPDVALQLARAADGRFLYVLGRKIASYEVDAAAPGLAVVNDTDTALPNWTGIAVDHGRRWLIVSDRMTGIAVFGLQ